MKLIPSPANLKESSPAEFAKTGPCFSSFSIRLVTETVCIEKHFMFH